MSDYSGTEGILPSYGQGERSAIALETLATEFSKLNVIMAAQGTGLTIKSWAHLQEIIRLGQVRNYLSVGDQLIVEKAAGADTWIENESGETGITSATVTFETFESMITTMSHVNFFFVYDGTNWQYEGDKVTLSDYGIAYMGTPIVGDTIVIHKKATDLVFDVIGIDHDLPAGKSHSITIHSHNALTITIFDNSEALIYVGETLAAGTAYTIGVDNSYDKPYHTYDYYTFTPTADIAAGSQIMFNWSYHKQPTGVTVYPSGTSTSGTTYSVTGEDTASGMLLCNATNTGITTSGEIDDINLIAGNQVNSLQRCRYGSNYYVTSGLRQYLNTDAATSGWWKPQTVFDRPHSMNNQANWLYGMDGDFLAVVHTIEKGIYTQKWDNGTTGNSTETFTDKFFLLSYKEVTGCTSSPYNSEAEGVQYEYYNNLIGTVTSDDQTNPALIKYDSSGMARSWWFRSSHSGNSTNVLNCSSSGDPDVIGAINGNGVCPACVIA